MPQGLNEEAWKQFIMLCQKIQSAEELRSLFDLFLTIEEKETIASRYVIIQELMKGKRTQREISKVFGVSIAQITRGSNALKIVDPTLRDLLERNMEL